MCVFRVLATPEISPLGPNNCFCLIISKVRNVYHKYNDWRLAGYPICFFWLATFLTVFVNRHFEEMSLFQTIPLAGIATVYETIWHFTTITWLIFLMFTLKMIRLQRHNKSNLTVNGGIHALDVGRLLVTVSTWRIFLKLQRSLFTC